MMLTHSQKQYLKACILSAVVFFSYISIAAAQSTDYQPLTGLPGVTDTNQLNLASYVNALFLLSIALGAMLAVIKIAIAGFKYMMTDVVTTKGDAKGDITNALLGLGILLATFVVLYTINPELTSLDVLSNAEKTLISGPTPRSTTTTEGGDGTGNGFTCPTGYKARLKVTVGGSAEGGEYECVPKSCPTDEHIIKNPDGNNPAYICGSVESGKYLWATFAENNTQIDQAKQKCEADGGVTSSSPQEDGSVYITCTSK